MDGGKEPRLAELKVKITSETRPITSDFPHTAMSSVRRSGTRRFPLGGLKFPQSFPIFENLLPLYGNFGNFQKINEIEHNLIIILT